jgi:hypothetical protein
MKKFAEALATLTGVTFYSTTAAADSYVYCSVRVLGGVVEVLDKGYFNWQPLASLTALPSLNRHQREVAKLAPVVVAILAGEVTMPEGYAFALPCLCASGCGKWLHHPRRIEEGYGPACGSEYANRAARAAAKSAAAASFMTRVLERTRPSVSLSPATVIAAGTRCPGTCHVNAYCPDCD